MSKVLVYREETDGDSAQLIGMKSSILTQEEIVRRAAVQIQPKLTPPERTFLMDNSNLPLMVPMTSYSKDDQSQKLRAKTVVEQLSDLHLGTTDFRSICKTCNGDVLGCSSAHSGVHEFSWLVCPVSYSNIVVNFIDSICFSCCKFHSKQYEEALSAEPLSDFDTIVEASVQSKHEASKNAMRDVNVAQKRFENFLALKKSITKDLLKQSAENGLFAIECQRCGMIQPSSIVVKDKVVKATWNIARVRDDGSRSVWYPSPGSVFWDKLLSIFTRWLVNFRRTNPGVIGDVHDSTQSLGMFFKSVLMKLPSAMDDDEFWISRVSPFLLNDPKSLDNILNFNYTYANVKMTLSRVPIDYMWMIGRSPKYDHLQDLIWKYQYIPSKLIRPSFQESSGGDVSADDPITKSYDLILQASAKLRKHVIVQSKDALSSWSKFLKMPIDQLTESVFGKDEFFCLYDYAGDVRMSHFSISDGLIKKLSSLQCEISSTFDHTIAKKAFPKPPNSALVGAKNAKELVRSNNRAKTPASKKSLHTETGMDVDEIVSESHKRPSKRSKLANIGDDDESRQSLGSNRDEETVCNYDAFKMPTICEVSDENSKKAWITCIKHFFKSWNNSIGRIENVVAKSEMFANTRPLKFSIITSPGPVGRGNRSSNSNSKVLHGCDDISTPEWTEYSRSHSLVYSKDFPQPEQLATLMYSGSGMNSAFLSQRTLEGIVGKKKGFIISNVLSKRLNKSCRVVLGPDGNIGINEAGIPYRICLSQTKPIVVSRLNYKILIERFALSRFYNSEGLMPDLGGVESIVTNDGNHIYVNGWIHPSEALFNDEQFQMDFEKKKQLIKKYGKKHIIDKWKPILKLGWTVYAFLEHGDRVIISRPPILQKANHNCHMVVPVPGFCMLLNVGAMNGYSADADGDALMIVIMESLVEQASMIYLMPIENNMQCPGKHLTICAQQQDALLGTCLIISECLNDTFKLDKRNAMKLLSCIRMLTPKRVRLTNFSSSTLPTDPRGAHGLLWDKLKLFTVSANGIVQRRNDHLDDQWGLPSPNFWLTKSSKGKKTSVLKSDVKLNANSKPYWSAKQILEVIFPKDFCYTKRLEGCNIPHIDIRKRINDWFMSDASRLKNDEARQIAADDFFASFKNQVVIILNGKWLCGKANKQTLSVSSGSIVECMWRNYGKYYACDWLSDASFIAQTYLSEIRGFSCGIEDIVMGGRSLYSIDGDDEKGLEEHEFDDQSRRKTDEDVEDESVVKLLFDKINRIAKIEDRRRSLFKTINEAFDKANKFIDDNAHVLSKENVDSIYEKLDVFAVRMKTYGAAMFTSYNEDHSSNNISTMSTTGSKGSKTNTAVMAATSGVPRLKNGSAVGSTITPNTRNFASELCGERSASSLGFVNLGLIHGLTSKQFFQGAKEARNRIIGSSSPAPSGYMMSQSISNAIAASIRYDGSVMNQMHEMIQLNYNGDGYNSVHVKCVFVGPEEFSAMDRSSGRCRTQLLSLWELVLSKFHRRPEYDFLGESGIKKKGVNIFVNVDIHSLLILHTGRARARMEEAKENEGSYHGEFNPIKDEELSELFDSFVVNVLSYDPSKSLLPFDFLFVVRLFITREISPCIEFFDVWACVDLLNSFFLSYTENMAEPGQAVGAEACQSANQPTTQLIMKSFKSDIAGVSQMTHISSGLPRLTEINNFTPPKGTLTHIVLSPEWVVNEVQARFVCSQLSCVMMNEWVHEEGRICKWLKLANVPGNLSRLELFDEGDSVLPGYFQLSRQILNEYSNTTENDGHDLHNTGDDDGNDVDGEIDTQINITHHEVCMWRLKQDILNLPGVREYVDAFASKKSSPISEKLLALEFIQKVWKRSLLEFQFGGLILCESRSASDLRSTTPFVEENIYLWMAFRHDEKDMFNLKMIEQNESSAVSVNVRRNTAHSDNWMNSVESFSSNLASSLVLIGDVEIGPVMQITEPSRKFTKINEEDELSEIPDVDECWRIQFKSKSILPFLSHPCVIDQNCYCSNIVDTLGVFGVESVAKAIPFESSKVLSSDDVYVQSRHLQLQSDIMTCDGNVLPMNRHGLFKKKKLSCLAGSSFEHIAKNIISTSLQAKFDPMDHVIPSVMFGQKEPYIGSSCCRVICPEDSQYDDDDATGTTTLGDAPVQDFNTLDVRTTEDDLMAIADFIVS